MRRLGHILLNLVTALLLLLVAVALWIRSQTVMEVISYRTLLERRNAGESKYRATSVVAFRNAIALRETIWSRYRETHATAAENDQADTQERRRLSAFMGWAHEPGRPAWLPTTSAGKGRLGFYSETSPPAPMFTYGPAEVVYGEVLSGWPFTRLRAAPWWALAMVFSVAPTLMLPRWFGAARRWSQARLRARAGQCRRCGYDLRATPDRCPECGTPAEPAAAREERRESANP